MAASRKCPAPPPDLDLKRLSADNKPENTREILPWALWYLQKEIYGVKSRHTGEAQREDLQKFIVFFHQDFPSGNIEKWDKALTQAFLLSLDEQYGCAVSTINRVRATLVSFANFLSRKGIISDDEDPVKGVKAPRIEPTAPQSLQVVAEHGKTVLEGREVFELMVDSVKKQMKIGTLSGRALPYRNISMLTTLFYTGLRASEICSLTLKQVEHDLESGGCFFRKVRCKGNKVRDVFMRDIGIRAMMEYIENDRSRILGRLKKKRRSIPQHIYLSHNGRPLTRIDIGRIVTQMAYRAAGGIEDSSTDLHIKAHPHSLRHERAYALLGAGFGESFVAEELGHSSTAYVGRYTKRSEKERVQRLKNI